MVKKPKDRLTGDVHEDHLEKAPPLLRVSPEGRAYCILSPSPLFKEKMPDSCLPSRVFVVAIDVSLQSFEILVDQGCLESIDNSVDQ